IFAKLNRRTSPESSRLIKPLSSGLPVSTPTALLPTVQPHAHPLIHSATVMAAQPYHWSECGRAMSLANSSVLGCPHRSVRWMTMQKQVYILGAMLALAALMVWGLNAPTRERAIRLHLRRLEYW